MPTDTSQSPCHLSLDALSETLVVLECGLCWHTAPPRTTVSLGCDVELLCARQDGQAIGFRAGDVHEIDPCDLDSRLTWSAPRFCVPALAQYAASVGEILLAAQARYRPGDMTADQEALLEAIDARHDDRPDDAVHHWTRMLEAGGQAAHKGLGAELTRLGRHRAAYGHLRHYTELCPPDPYGWYLLATAAEALGELREALEAYRISLRLERRGANARHARERCRILEATIEGAGTR